MPLCLEGKEAGREDSYLIEGFKKRKAPSRCCRVVVCLPLARGWEKAGSGGVLPLQHQLLFLKFPPPPQILQNLGSSHVWA